MQVNYVFQLSASRFDRHTVGRVAEGWGVVGGGVVGKGRVSGGVRVRPDCNKAEKWVCWRVEHAAHVSPSKFGIEIDFMLMLPARFTINPSQHTNYKACLSIYRLALL